LNNQKLNRDQKHKKAFIERVMKHQGIIHKVCHIYCDNDDDRKDLFQEIMINLWKSFPSYRGDAAFSTWMYKVSLNIAIQQLRESDKRKEYATLPGEFDKMSHQDSESLPDREMKLLKTAINRLNKVEKAIIMLYLEGKGNEEISEIIGISQNYVRVKMTRIRTKLTRIINQEICS